MGILYIPGGRMRRIGKAIEQGESVDKTGMKY